MICYTSEKNRTQPSFFLTSLGLAGGGVVMKDGSGVAEKVEKTSATAAATAAAADADLIEERAAFEQRPKEGRKERRKERGCARSRRRRGRTRR